MTSRVLIWGSGSGPCWRVQIVLAEKNLKYDSQLIEFSKSKLSILAAVLSKSATLLRARCCPSKACISDARLHASRLAPVRAKQN